MNISFIVKCSPMKHYRRHLCGRPAPAGSYSEHAAKRYSQCTCSLLQNAPDITSNDKRTRARLFSGKACVQGTALRCYTTKGDPPTSPVRRLPPLMNFPEIVWPSLVKSLRNFILTTFIIKPYFDRDFNIPDFISGSKKAVEVVSSKISEGEMGSLGGLVASDAIPELQKSVSTMSLTQRQQISINLDDIYFSFPYQIGIMFEDEESKNQKRFVEITMVYHTLRGLQALKTRGEDLPLNVGMLPQYRDNISICNYRFIREFTKGVEGEWTVNLLNHFKPSDYIDN